MRFTENAREFQAKRERESEFSSSFGSDFNEDNYAAGLFKLAIEFVIASSLQNSNQSILFRLPVCMRSQSDQIASLAMIGRFALLEREAGDKWREKWSRGHP